MDWTQSIAPEVLGRALSGFAFIALVLLIRHFVVSQLRRERGLRAAVEERTQELEKERSRERARNQVFEMVLANQTLGLVLDHIAKLLRTESPDAACVIVMRRKGRSEVVSASGAPASLITALKHDYAIPFEVWQGATEWTRAVSTPIWSIFSGALASEAPEAIRTSLIGTPERTLGTCLVFEKTNPSSGADAAILENAARLAQLAIEQSRFRDEINFQARHDSLTGLPNRALFEDRLGQAISEAGNLGQKLAVLFVDLDKFKHLNDTMSHRSGDLLLIEIALRLKQALRPRDIVARIGGDEFSILLPDLADAAEAETVAARILEAVRRPLLLNGRTVPMSASIGIAVFPEDGHESEELQRRADAAMYCAKGLGRDRIQLCSAQNHALDTVRLDGELQKALRDRLFSVHYQPKVNAGGGFVGMEALIRLCHPVHGRIPPSDFIPMAEESGLIVPLGAWVLDEVCRQIAQWFADGLGVVAVAVNVSQVQICRPGFATEVEDCLRRHGISPFSLELELTESLLIGSGEETQQQMSYLRGLGIRFSIDDFGTGYSSLSYLHRLRVDAIKLDRSFVQSIDTDDAARRLVQAMIGVAEGLGLGVIAEGVETEAQRQTLILAGCPMMQGYLFSRPKPAAELEDYLRTATSDTDDLMRIGNAVMVNSGTVPLLAEV